MEYYIGGGIGVGILNARNNSIMNYSVNKSLNEEL